MKFYASILLISMLGLNLGSFIKAFERTVPETEMSCDSNDCCGADNKGEDQSGCDEEKGCEDEKGCKEKHEKGIPCHCGCDCSPGIQIVAINHHIPTPNKLIPMEHLYVSLDINFKSQYPNPRFQPPRIA